MHVYITFCYFYDCSHICGIIQSTSEIQYTVTLYTHVYITCTNTYSKGLLFWLTLCNVFTSMSYTYRLSHFDTKIKSSLVQIIS